ncbi:MAG: TorF family putative porin [Pseudomonadota bacterium]
MTPAIARTLALALALASGHASAQATFSASLASDYRFRGMSLSAERAAPGVAVNIDTSSGLYAGASLMRARFLYTPVDLQAIAYAGYVRRFDADVSWDAGVTETRFSGAKRYNYRELHAGVSSERFSARMYWSPHYFGIGKSSVYAEVKGSHPLTDRIELVGHVGHLLRPVSRTDVRIGLAAALDEWTVQLAWVANRDRASQYPFIYSPHARRLVLSTSRVF